MINSALSPQMRDRRAPQAHPISSPGGGDKVLLKVNTCKTHTLSITLRIQNTASAGDVCELLGNKLEIRGEAFVRHNLILVRKSVFPRSRVITTLHTLSSDDVVTNVRDRSIERCSGLHCELLWYFKDKEAEPLQIDGYVSGESDSDEDEGGERDSPLPLRVFMPGSKRSGIVLKKSRRDPNLWRERLLVLYEDTLICFNMKRSPVRRSIIVLDGDLAVSEKSTYMGADNIIMLDRLHVMGAGSTVFRVRNKSERSAWICDILSIAKQRQENEAIVHAEMMMTDETYVRLRNAQQRLETVLHAPSSNDIFLNGTTQLGLMGTGNRECDPSINACWLAPRNASTALDRKYRHHRTWIAVRSVCQSPTLAREVMSFLLAVQRYEDTFRTGFFFGADTAWEMAVRIYARYLHPHLEVNQPGDRDRSSSSGLWGWPPTHIRILSTGTAIQQVFELRDLSMTSERKVHASRFSDGENRWSNDDSIEGKATEDIPSTAIVDYQQQEENQGGNTQASRSSHPHRGSLLPGEAHSDSERKLMIDIEDCRGLVTTVYSARSAHLPRPSLNLFSPIVDEVLREQKYGPTPDNETHT